MNDIRQRIQEAFPDADLSAPPTVDAEPAARLPGLLWQSVQGTEGGRRELAELLGFTCAIPVDREGRAAWVRGLSLEACHVIEAVWDATDDLDACSVVRQARVWRELAEAPIDAASWWATITDFEGGRARLAKRVEAAFDGTPPPESRTLWAAQAAAGYGSDDRPGHAGRWQDVPRRDLMRCEEALPWLDDAGKRYYVPAMMTLVLRFRLEWVDGFPIANPGWLWLALGWTSLEPATFQPEQQVVIDQFFRAMGFEGDVFDTWR